MTTAAEAATATAVPLFKEEEEPGINCHSESHIVIRALLGVQRVGIKLVANWKIDNKRWNTGFEMSIMALIHWHGSKWGQATWKAKHVKFVMAVHRKASSPISFNFQPATGNVEICTKQQSAVVH